MKSFRLPMFLALTALSAALALAGFARPAVAAEGIWQTDFKAAQAQAKKEKKNLLVDFTGSTWCGWCIKLHNEVFYKEPFTTEAPKQFVLVELDFPEQMEEAKKEYRDLAEKYKVEGFPTVLVMDAEGQVIAHTGYHEGGPVEYLKQLADFSKIYEKVVALKAGLDKSKGLDRAKLLDEIVESYKKLGNDDSDEVAAWCKEIIALDPDNKAGLKIKYEFPLELAKADKLLQAGNTDEAKQVLDKALALQGVPGEMRQEGFMLRVQVDFAERKFANVVATLKLAKEAAPESSVVKHIDDGIAQFTKVAEAQETAAKLEAGLASAKGIDRAKLLDKLVEANQKLLQFDPEAHDKIGSWTKEIVALDPDNKAGLKKKYQFKAVLADATSLIRAGKSDEANAALDKALASEGISPDETQQVEFLKAQVAFRQSDREQGVVHLKKALAAAPDSELAATLKMMIQQFGWPNKPVPQKPTEN